MQWNEIVSPLRLRESEKGNHLKLTQVVASDHGRVVFSSPFRRLQKKAQVFSLEDNAAVRSRMTHSIEVSHVGRYIAEKISDAGSAEITGDLIKVLPAIAEISCLLHDIGNPPFGHLGEAAIQNWFTKWLERKKIDPKIKTEWLDFIYFDGNPQGFRIITKLQGEPGEKGLNLTCTQLMSFMKYPAPPSEIDSGVVKYKKPGYFSSEQKEYDKCIERLKMAKKIKHPIVYIMEAADDIAYSLSDIEDGIEKGLLNSDDVFDSLRSYIKNQSEESKKDQAIKIINDAIDYAQKKPAARDAIKIMRFRISMINKLVDVAAAEFLSKESQYLIGGGDNIFADGSAARMALDAIRDIVKIKVYESREAEDIEISGYNVMHSLLDDFGCLLDLDGDVFLGLIKKDKKIVKKYPYEKRLTAKLPRTFIENYIHDVETQAEYSELFHRSHMLVDYICGMTDDFSLRIHQLLTGIRVESI